MPAGKIYNHTKYQKKLERSAATKLQAAARALSGRKKRKPPLSNKKLTNKVKTLEKTQRGSIQYDRQYCVWNPIDPPQQDAPYYYNPAHPSVIRPIAFLHQAISRLSRVHTLRYLRPIGPGTPPTLNPTEGGIWNKQAFPLSIQGTPPDEFNLAPGQVDLNDQLQFWDQAEGVSNDYTHYSTKYEMQIHANDCRGYCDIFIVHPKKSYIRSVQSDISLPLGLAGFTNLSLGTHKMYSINKEYYTCKRLKRIYFNTAAPAGAPPTSSYLQTNPDYSCTFTVKNKKSRQRIRAPELAEGALLDSTDIPYSKQDWIIISTTLENQDVTATNNLNFKIWRTPTWRDRTGAST